MSLYIESFRVEAREQLRLIIAYRYGHPTVDSKEYIEGLKLQADPPDKEEAKNINPVEGFERLQRMFGREIRG